MTKCNFETSVRYKCTTCGFEYGDIFRHDEVIIDIVDCKRAYFSGLVKDMCSGQMLKISEKPLSDLKPVGIHLCRRIFPSI